MMRRGSRVYRRWQGVVQEIRGKEFTAKLEDLSGEADDILATFQLRQVRPLERDLVEEGAIFLWVVSACNGKNTSRVRFFRITWTAADTVAALREMESLKRWIGYGEPEF